MSAPQRERARVQAPAGIPAATLSPGAVAHALRSGLSLVPQRRSQRSCVPGNGESPERSFSPLSLLQLQCRGSVSKAWVPEPPPLWQRSATCRAADHLQRRSERVCVCARAEEGGLPVCVCMRLYTHVSLKAVWAREGWVAASPQPPDPGLEVTAVAVTPYLSLGARCLICLEGWSDLRWDSDTCSPSPSSHHVRLRSRGKHFWLLCRVWDSPEFLLYDPGGWAGWRCPLLLPLVSLTSCCSDSHLAWLLL